jgi:hypothetical protein
LLRLRSSGTWHCVVTPQESVPLKSAENSPLSGPLVPLSSHSPSSEPIFPAGLTCMHCR